MSAAADDSASHAAKRLIASHLLDTLSDGEERTAVRCGKDIAEKFLLGRSCRR